MEIKLYGTRGSIASPLQNRDFKKKVHDILNLYKTSGLGDINEFWSGIPDHLKYLTGGDTTCVSITSSSGSRYMIDAGTGARVFGDSLMQKEFAKGEGSIQVFITHTHWDHIQGIPFFKPLYIPGNDIVFHSRYPDLEERLGKQMETEFFPISFHSLAATKTFYTLKSDDRVEFADGVTVSSCPLKHPGGSTAYKFTENGKSFVFATDVEFTGNDFEYAKSLDGFFGGADVLVIDSQYTLDDSFSKFDWGHTAYTMAINCAHMWNIKNLVLTHHEPVYDDYKIHEIEEMALEHYDQLEKNTNKKMKIFIAREGMNIQL